MHPLANYIMTKGFKGLPVDRQSSLLTFFSGLVSGKVRYSDPTITAQHVIFFLFFGCPMAPVFYDQSKDLNLMRK